MSQSTRYPRNVEIKDGMASLDMMTQTISVSQPTKQQ